ncbi:hypothetical protein Pmani_026775 [Petrolisthes manimaculis]|uniref:Uncharacterized protein n=1 Tax=Petrolisthes manimaculis TaxID=1843537 RepID=A0AAE1P410_9EUCA|nr:hypothetical protein Pmani_026775 [Petrolisthes manimaculis]
MIPSTPLHGASFNRRPSQTTTTTTNLISDLSSAKDPLTPSTPSPKTPSPIMVKGTRGEYRRHDQTTTLLGISHQEEEPRWWRRSPRMDGWRMIRLAPGTVIRTKSPGGRKGMSYLLLDALITTRLPRGVALEELEREGGYTLDC